MLYSIGTTVLDHYWQSRSDQLPESLIMRAPSGQWVMGRGSPTHQQVGHPGHTYSVRPDLTSSGHLVLAGRAATAAAPVVVLGGIPLALAGANVYAIKRAPKTEQRSLWRVFTSGLTGTFGIGGAGSRFV